MVFLLLALARRPATLRPHHLSRRLLAATLGYCVAHRCPCYREALPLAQPMPLQLPLRLPLRLPLQQPLRMCGGHMGAARVTAVTPSRICLQQMIVVALAALMPVTVRALVHLHRSAGGQQPEPCEQLRAPLAIATKAAPTLLFEQAGASATRTNAGCPAVAGGHVAGAPMPAAGGACTLSLATTATATRMLLHTMVAGGQGE